MKAPAVYISQKLAQYLYQLFGRTLFVNTADVLGYLDLKEDPIFSLMI
jgi:hypothetical protein